MANLYLLPVGWYSLGNFYLLLPIGWWICQWHISQLTAIITNTVLANLI